MSISSTPFSLKTVWSFSAAGMLAMFAQLSSASAQTDAAAQAAETVEEMGRQASDAAVAAYGALTGDAKAGRRVFAKCMACHTVKEGQNRVGPSLHKLLGREAGTVEKFKYSDANMNSGIVWDEAILFEYLEKPQEFMPGTRMIFPGLPKEQDRANVIAYIKSESE